MPENVQPAIVHFASMVAWMNGHPGVNVDEIVAHFHHTCRQVRHDIEYLASVGDSLSGASFELGWELYEQERRVSLRSTLGASAPLRLPTLEIQALPVGLPAITPLLGMDLAAHVPYVALVVYALGGLKEVDVEQRVEAIPSLALSGKSLETLRDAPLRRERVSFTYVSASDVCTRRTVNPWSFEASVNGWPLCGWCTRVGEARSFVVVSINDMHGEGLRVEESRHIRHDVPAWTFDVDRDTRWIAGEYDDHIVAGLDGGGAHITLPVQNRQWGMSLLIDIAPHLRVTTPDTRDEAIRRTHSVLSIWTREDAS